MDYEQLENAITEKTKVIIPVDLGGVPCDYDRIFSIVERKKGLFHPANKIQESIGRVIVMADAAHAFGATWKEKPVGRVADFSNFSFHAVKNFTTAEGGAVAWRDIEGIDNEEIYHQYQLLSLHGQSKECTCEKRSLWAWEYDIIGPWFKCNMTDVVAGIGLAQMKRYKGLLERRKEIIGKYDAAFKPIGIEVLNHYTENHQSSGHLYITRVPGITLEQRHEIIVKMAESGVACNVHYKPLPMMTAYKNMGFDIKDYPNAYTPSLTAMENTSQTSAQQLTDPEETILCHPDKKKKTFFPGRIAGFIRKFPEKIRNILQKILYFLRNIQTFWKKGTRTCRKWYRFFNDEKNKKAFSNIWKQLEHLVVSVLPKRLKLWLKYSTGSPDTTGQVLGILAIFPVGYRNHWNIIPDFTAEEFYAEADFTVHGRIFGVQILALALRIILDKNCRRLYNRFKHMK